MKAIDSAPATPVSTVMIKICGLTNLADAAVAAEAGADLLGFIFYEKSPRYAAPAAVAEIVRELRRSMSVPRLVGVFVNAAPEQISETLAVCGLDLAQLHGEEGRATMAQLAGKAFKAVRPQSLEEAERTAGGFASFGPAGGPDILLDAYHPALRGGTGVQGDWELAASLARRYRILLAGGLTPDNVGEAIRQVSPWGVDVSSGVEATPGRKAHDRVRSFVAAVRGRE